jgi:hypothetical protein
MKLGTRPRFRTAPRRDDVTTRASDVFGSLNQPTVAHAISMQPASRKKGLTLGDQQQADRAAPAFSAIVHRRRRNGGEHRPAAARAGPNHQERGVVDDHGGGDVARGNEEQAGDHQAAATEAVQQIARRQIGDPLACAKDHRYQRHHSIVGREDLAEVERQGGPKHALAQIEKERRREDAGLTPAGCGYPAGSLFFRQLQECWFLSEGRSCAMLRRRRSSSPRRRQRRDPVSGLGDAVVEHAEQPFAPVAGRGVDDICDCPERQSKGPGVADEARTVQVRLENRYSSPEALASTIRVRPASRRIGYSAARRRQCRQASRASRRGGRDCRSST